MPERPSVFEGTRIGIQADVDTPVVPNRQLQSLSLTGMPDPKEPATVVRAAGRRAASDLVRQKGHTEAQLTGPQAYLDNAYAAILTWGNPDAIVNLGSGVYDWIWRPAIDSDPHPKAATFENGSTDFPGRFTDAQALSATLTFGKTENRWESDVAGRRLDETTGSFAGTVTLVPIVPIAPKDNGHYLGTAVYTLYNSAVCDTETVTVTAGRKREPHFSQCPASTQPSFQSILPVDESNSNLVTLQLQHKSTSRALLTNLRNNDLLYYGHKNVGQAITNGGGMTYEQQLTVPVKILESGGTGDSDNATARTWNLKPVLDPNLNVAGVGTAGGYWEYRLRIPLASVPSASNL